MTQPNTVPINEIPTPYWDEIVTIPIVDDGTPLHPTSLAAPMLRTHPIYFVLGVPSAIPECMVREAVYHRLLAAAQALPDGIGLVVLDAWRPYAVQRYLYDMLLGMIKDHYAGLDDIQRRAKTREFVSPPSIRPECPSPHLTGGAVDVTLCDANGLLLDMGSAFDEARSESHTRHYETHTNEALAQTYRERRRILYHAMTQAGFANLPSEWWHYSFGDQMWAWYAGRRQATFGVSAPYRLEERWRYSLSLAR